MTTFLKTVPCHDLLLEVCDVASSHCHRRRVCQTSHRFNTQLLECAEGTQCRADAMANFLKLTITTNKPKTIAVITVIIHEPKCPFKCGYIIGLKVHHHSVTSMDVSWMTTVDKVWSHCSPPPHLPLSACCTCGKCLPPFVPVMLSS